MGRSLDVELNTNAPHDTTMNISCSENYELASSLPIRCNNGTWTEEPKCEPARCKILPSPPLNGMVVVSFRPTWIQIKDDSHELEFMTISYSATLLQSIKCFYFNPCFFGNINSFLCYMMQK